MVNDMLAERLPFFSEFTKSNENANNSEGLILS